jgi:RecA-family ATPase
VQVRQFVGFLRRLAIRHSVTIMLIAHPSIYGMNSGEGTSGNTGWRNSVRGMLYLAPVKAANG